MVYSNLEWVKNIIHKEIKKSMRNERFQDWRMHLEQMNTMNKTMSDLMEKTKPQLDTVSVPHPKYNFFL